MAPNSQIDIQKIAALLNAGKLDLALKKAVLASKKYPNNPIFPQMAGAALIANEKHGSEKHGAAALHFHKSYKIKPDHAEFQDNLARSLIASGQIESAESLLNKHADARQGSPVYHHLWALLHMRKKHYQDAIDAASKTLDLQPGHLEALLIRGNARAAVTQSDGALQDYNAVLAGNPDLFEAAEGRAAVLSSLGKVEEVKQQYFDLLKQNPTHTASLQMLSGLPGMTDQDLSDLDACLDRAEASLGGKKDKQASELNFARHEVAMRRGQTAQAMEFLSIANAQAARSEPFDDAAAERKCKAILAMLDVPTSSNPDVAIPRPIFVVGLPRSGTTLMEMTIGAHRAVQGCGELTAAGTWVNRNKLNTCVDGLSTYYREQLPPLQDNIVAIVDKMPSNYRYLGFIAAAFPNSVIINVDRDPRDVALSMWRKNFSSSGMAYTTDQRQMAAEANRYRRYLNHWTALLGKDRIYTVSYEELVGDFATQVQKIATVCGLEWDPNMLTPEANTAAVNTASLFQVRKAVHTGSIKAWEPFADDLKVFTDHLDKDLWAHYL